jgi:hypothetical protein
MPSSSTMPRPRPRARSGETAIAARATRRRRSSSRGSSRGRPSSALARSATHAGEGRAVGRRAMSASAHARQASARGQAPGKTPSTSSLRITPEGVRVRFGEGERGTAGAHGREELGGGKMPRRAARLFGGSRREAIVDQRRAAPVGAVACGKPRDHHVVGFDVTVAEPERVELGEGPARHRGPRRARALAPKRSRHARHRRAVGPLPM